MWILLLAAAQAADDCALDTDGYVALRRSLRQLKVAQGHGIVAAGGTEGCDAALTDVVRNDPTLAVQVAGDAGAVRAALDPFVHCGAVVWPDAGPDGFRLEQVGECVAPVGRDDSPQRVWSAAYWGPGDGLSLRWTEWLGGGASLVLDGAVGLDTSTLALQQVPGWRVLGGVDLSELGLLSSMYAGARGGLQDRGQLGPGDRELVAQVIVGHRWVARAVALQLGGGVTMQQPVTPTAETMGGEVFVPTLELRLGLPSGW